MEDFPLLGFLKVIGVSLVPVVVFGAALHARQAFERAVALGRRWHLLSPALPVPTTPPLEKLAADLRRLRPDARSPRPGVTMARHRGVVAAYDDALVAASVVLEVETNLKDLPEGIEREAERLRLESALERAGLSWRVRPEPPRPGVDGA